MAVYVGFSRPIKSNPVSSMIAWWMRRPYSHVYLRFESSNPSFPSTVYHAARGMVHFLTFERFLASNYVVVEYKLDVSAEQKLQILTAAIKLCGEKYSYFELLQITFCDLVYRLFKVELLAKDAPGYICSELVGKMLANVLHVAFDKPLSILKPSDIESKLSSLGCARNDI